MRPLGNIESITALDDYSVEFAFKTELGVGDLDKTLTECPVVSQAAYEASDDQFSTHPVGTGPYVVTDYVPGSSLTYEKRADYWQTPELTALFSKSNVDKIIFQVVTEPAQHAIALESGTANISANISGDDIDRFVDNSDFNVFKFQDNLTWYMNFNGSKEVFQSKELRQAMAYAIDTTAILFGSLLQVHVMPHIQLVIVTLVAITLIGILNLTMIMILIRLKNYLQQQVMKLVTYPLQFCLSQIQKPH